MSAIVVAGGVSKRFGQEKCLAELVGKPLILHVLNKLPLIVDEIVVVVSSKEQKLKIYLDQIQVDEFDYKMF